jgi:hypothetical protein
MESIMNTLPTTLYRDLTCGAAAILITLVLAASFVDSTATPPGAASTSSSFLAVQPAHGWFGQPQPAVLVD